MSFTSWLRILRSAIAPAGLERPRRAKPLRRRPAATYRPQLEMLEDRLAPASLTVNSLADNITDTSVLTLRGAIELVNNAGNPAALGQASLPSGWSSQIAGDFGTDDAIQFDPSLFGATQQTVTLGGSQLLLTRSVTITGPGADRLAISGDHASRVFAAYTGAYTISGLTIENGTDGGVGGGILNGGTMTVTGCTLFGNSGDEGGGIYNQGTMTVSDTTLFGNYGDLGAGIYNSYSGTMTVSDSTLSENFGSGIYNYGPGILNVTDDSTVSGNSGAGIVNFGGRLTVSDSTLSGNTTGIHNFAITAGTGYVSSPTLAVSNSTLSDNTGYGIYSIGGSVTVTSSALSRNGGGILNGSTRSAGGHLVLGSATINDSTLSDNTRAGGIVNGGTMTVTGTSLTGNSAYNGGGISNGGTLTVSGSTLSGNSATFYGGGIHNTGTLSVADSIVCGNIAPAGADLYNTGVFTQTNSDVCIINLVTTTTTVFSSLSTSVFVQDVTFTARVSPVVSVGDQPTGIVTFLLDGVTPLGVRTIDSSGQASVTIAGLVAGTYSITATYDGDATFIASTSAEFTQTVLATASTTTTVTNSFSPSVFGQEVTFWATVGAVIPGAGTPTGTVTFLLDGSTPLGASTLDSYGWATLATAALPVGDHIITASYPDDSYFTASTGSTPLTVSPASTSMIVASSSTNGTSVFGQSVTFTVTVNAVAPGAGKPTGTVQFQLDGQNFGNPATLDANGNASLTTSALPVGSHGMTAVYSGDAQFIASSAVAAGTITTVAGNGTGGYLLAGPATTAALNAPNGVAVDAAGNLFIADVSNNVIRKVDAATGIITVVAGNGGYGHSGDGGRATEAALQLRAYYYGSSTGVAVDGAGNLFFADAGNNVIRKVSPAGIITTVASTVGVLYLPTGIAVNAAGDLFIADTGNYLIRKVDARTGEMTTIVGYSGTTRAYLDQPTGVAVATNGDLFIADQSYEGIRKVDGTTGVISTVAGTEYMYYAAGIAVDAVGNLFIANPYGDNVIVEVRAGGGVTTVAGTAGVLNQPTGLAFNAAGDLFIADTYNNVIRRVRDGVIATVAGGGSLVYLGNGGPATAAVVFPTGVAVNAAGELFIADGYNNVIRKVSPTGVITIVAGNGTWGYSGDGGSATAASLNQPTGIAVDAAGNLFFADLYNQVIRKVSPDGIITTVAGNGGYGYSGDDGPATAASLAYPQGVAVDAAGNLFIADSNNNVIRKVSPDGIITTVAGNGGWSYNSGEDGGPATAASLANPQGVAVDGAGNLFIADFYHQVIRKVSPEGIITTVAGNGAYGYSGDGGPATDASLAYPQGVAVDAAGNLFIADLYNRVIRKVDAKTGIITTVAGAAGYGGDYPGDGGPATTAQLSYPSAVAVDAAGNLFIADDVRVRKVGPSVLVTQAGTTTTLASSSSTTVFGQAVTFTATVVANTPGAGAPTGAVTFLLDGRSLGAALLDGTGHATFTTAELLSLGEHTITAIYSGNANFVASSSAGLTQTIVSAQQQLALIVDQVSALVTAGILDSRTGDTLTKMLNTAITSLNSLKSGTTTAGVNQLNAVHKLVDAFETSRKLTSTDAQTLFSAIDEAIAAALASPI